MTPVELKQIAEQAFEHPEEIVYEFDFEDMVTPELALKLCALWEAVDDLKTLGLLPKQITVALKALEEHKQ